MIEAILAGLVLAVCLALLLRMALPERQRRRLDAAWRRLVQAGQRLAQRAWFWRRHKRHAAREADEAIRRAQRRAERDGNVVRPDAFKDPRKPH